MVGGTAAHLVEEVETLGESALEVVEGVDLHAGDLRELLHIGTEALLLDTESLVRTHGRDDLDVEGVICRNLLVPLKGVGRIVCGADQAHVGAADEIPAGELRRGELPVGKLPDLFCGIAVEHALIAEEALELEVAPLEDRVADAAGQGLCPLLELLTGRSIAGDIALIHAVGTHEAPLVVVAAEPDLRDGREGLVLPDFLRGDVAVIVENRHVLCIVMEELLARGGGEQEVLVVHKVLHRLYPFFGHPGHRTGWEASSDMCPSWYAHRMTPCPMPQSSMLVSSCEERITFSGAHASEISRKLDENRSRFGERYPNHNPDTLLTFPQERVFAGHRLSDRALDAHLRH